VFFLLGIFASPCTVIAGEQVSVISYNIYTYNDSGSSEYEALVRIVEALDPDILLIQEANNADGRQAFISHFDGRYPYNYLGGPTYENPRNQIFSTYPILQSGQIYTEDPNGGHFERPTIWSDIDIQPGIAGAEMRVYSAHYKAGSSSRDWTLKNNQAEDDANNVTNAIDSTPQLYVIHAGDLNSLTGETPLQTLLDPATTLSRLPLVNPNNGDDQTRWPSGKTIDHMLYSATLADHIVDHYIFHTETFVPGELPAPAQSGDSQTASDHLTLLATFDLPDPCPADLDDDGDVDGDDVSSFRQCISGSRIGPGTGCDASDLDADQDVDLSDFALLQRCLSGPYTPPPEGCFTN
jgi:endonuclease/exonuclease/phosphatase family metal-dependent hydrolase